MSSAKSMRGRQSVIVTPGDVKNYFKKKNPGVHMDEKEDGSLTVKSKDFDFTFTPKNPKYKVRIWAADDPTDSDEKVTPDPVKFIAGFLGAGLPGGEHFEKMSSGPYAVSGMLKRMAVATASGSVSRKRLAAMVRRAAISPYLGFVKKVVSLACRLAAGQDASREEIGKLREEMKKKGWKVEAGEDDAGNPELSVDVSGIYEARISMESMPYSYEMHTLGFPDLDETGVTEDPITTIRTYAKSDKVSEALERKKVESGQTEEAPGTSPSHGLPEIKAPPNLKREEETVRPQRLRSEKTVPAGR